MRIIGLCGRSGSGKTSFCRIAIEQGLKVIDCDKVYYGLVSNPSDCLEEIRQSFGDGVIKDNALDRKTLAGIVFSNREKLELLNSTTHKYIRNEIANIISACNESDIIILDAPALFESNVDLMCDSVVCIIAPDEFCVARIIARDGITEQQARSRLQNQLPNDFLIENSDYIVYNEGAESDFINASYELITALKEGIL